VLPPRLVLFAEFARLARADADVQDDIFELTERTMEGTAVFNSSSASPLTENNQPTHTKVWQHVLYLSILVLLAGAIRFWLIGHTAVAARDSIGYIRYALELESKPWSEVLRKNEQHPGYPAALLVTSWPVRHWMGGTTPASMQLSAQLATTLAAILLVFPLYFLGCELFNPKIAFWGAALFQCLPATARATADGLSEGIYFLCAVTAIWLAARALRTNSLVQFALCGLACGLAYLTRPEGALILVAAGIVLFGLQTMPAFRHSWSRVIACSCCLALAGLLAGSPYYLATGRFTQKSSVDAALGGQKPAVSPTGEVTQNLDSERTSFGPALLASGPDEGNASGPLLAIYALPTQKDRWLWAFKAIGVEVIQAYEYLLGIPLFLGIWLFRRTLRSSPAAWLLTVVCLLQIVVLWRLAFVMGYISERHVMTLVLCGVFTTAAALDWLGTKLAASPINFMHVGWVALAPLVLFTFCWLPVTLKPLHANRAGHKAAGQWLATHSDPADSLIDPFCWAHYYAGRVFLEDAPPKRPAGFKETFYAVVDGQEKDHVRLPLMPAATKRAQMGKVVYSWPENKPVEQAKVFVYAAQQGN
jgi:4-amino-4-deoxy-L-arabinose transferase-like glycosyltransferase